MIFFIGVIIGIVLGLTGAGGSVFAIPLLILALDLPVPTAVGISLATVFTSATFGVITHVKKTKIKWLAALLFALIGSVTAPIGSILSQHISEDILLILFSILVFFISIRMWLQATKKPNETKVVRANIGESKVNKSSPCASSQAVEFKFSAPCFIGLTVGASLTGILSGLFGVGGGFLIVPALLYLTGIPIKQAVASSLVAISLISASAFTTHLISNPEITYDLFILSALGGIVGMLIGIYLSRYIKGPNLQKIFAVTMSIMAIATIILK